MIVVWGLELGEAIIKVIFTILNVLPSVPEEMISTIDWYFDFLMQGIDLFASRNQNTNQLLKSSLPV